jgi:NADPH:quinone reductase-like Zn-dependent oxidoreductase
LSWEEAASVPVVFVVVHDGMFASAQLLKDETLLVTAVTAGVGTAALVLGKFLGARVIGTSRSAEKLEKLKSHGLDVVVVTGFDGMGEAVKAAAGPAGIDMVVDNIGADALEPCMETMNVGGRFCTIGRMSGVHTAEFNIDRLAEKRLHLYGVSNRLRNAAQRAESAKRFMDDLFPALSDGGIKPIVDRSFPRRRRPMSKPTATSARW